MVNFINCNVLSFWALLGHFDVINFKMVECRYKKLNYGGKTDEKNKNSVECARFDRVQCIDW